MVNPCRLLAFQVTLLLAMGSGIGHADEPPSEPKPVGSVPAAQLPDDAELSVIAFGSCARQDLPQPIWEPIADLNPDVFLFMGDNIYGDSEDMEILRAKYRQLGAKPGFVRLRQNCPVIATWDDHDYGVNDGGTEYPKKKDSQKVFLEFFEEPQNSPRWSREGIYHSRTVGPPGRRVQIILLDTRYFRSPLVRRQRTEERGEGIDGPYGRNLDSTATILGEAQWNWLGEVLRQPADLRILVTSIQFVPAEHGWEAWSRFPLERERLLRLIAETKANGVIVLSGDRHHAEISRLDRDEIGYPIFDLTASSLNKPMGKDWKNERNRHRIGSLYGKVNFGTLLIRWDSKDPLIRMQIRGGDGQVVLQQRIRLSGLQPQPE